LSFVLRDRIVSKHRSGKGYPNISAALKVPRTQWPLSFLNGRSLEPPRLFLQLGRSAKLTNRGRRTLVREVTKNLMVTLTEL
jgi:hypothetical protein